LARERGGGDPNTVELTRRVERLLELRGMMNPENWE